MWLMAFGFTAGTWTGNCRISVIRPSDFSSINVTVVNLRAMKGHRGRAVFIFNILDGLSGQLCAPAALPTGKYPPVGLAVERRLHWSIQAVWTFSIRDKYLAAARNRTTIPQTPSRVLLTILGVSRQPWATICEESYVIDIHLALVFLAEYSKIL